MSTEFKVGQVVYGDDFARLPVGSKIQSLGSKIQSLAAFPAHFTKVSSGNTWAYTDGAGKTDSTVFLDVGGPGRTLIYLPEPEDTDDVEPEPLKEGDWVQVWAKIEDVDRDSEGEVTVRLPREWGMENAEYVLADAIVRPSAGDLPPWATRKTEEPTGLGAVVVVNTNGWKWVRSRPGFAEPWTEVGGPGQRRWGDFPEDVEVLSEGWTGGAS